MLCCTRLVGSSPVQQSHAYVELVNLSAWSLSKNELIEKMQGDGRCWAALGALNNAENNMDISLYEIDIERGN